MQNEPTLDTNDLIALRTQAEYRQISKSELRKRVEKLIPSNDAYATVIEALLFLLDGREA